jgi:hypothetical protein
MRSRSDLQTLTSLPVKAHMIEGNCLTSIPFSEDKDFEGIEEFLQKPSRKNNGVQ